MNLISIQDRLTEKAKADASIFLTNLFHKFAKEIPVHSIPADALEELKAAIASNPKRSINLDFVLVQIKKAILPETETVFINTASASFLAKVNSAQAQLEEIQSQLA